MMNPRCGRRARGFHGGIPKSRMAMGNPLHTEVMRFEWEKHLQMMDLSPKFGWFMMENPIDMI